MALLAGAQKHVLPAGAVRGRAAGRRNVEGLNFDRELTGSGLGKGSIPDGMTIQDYPVKNGESIWDYFGEERRDMILEDAAANRGYAVSSPSTEHFGIAEDNRAWVQPKLTSHPLGTLLQPIRLAGTYAGPRTYVYASGPSSMTGWYPQFKDDPNWTVLVTACGHDQMVDAPDEVAAILTNSASAKNI